MPGPAPDRDFNLRRQSEDYCGTFGVACPLGQELVLVGERKSGRLVSSELPCSGVLLGSLSKEFVTIFNMRGHYAVPVCRYLDVDLSLNMRNARQRRIEWHFYSGYAW